MAIEDIENKIIKIRTENDNEKKDKVKLEMHLKGVVATVVNAGPLHVAETFLRFILKYRCTSDSCSGGDSLGGNKF